MKKFSFRLQSVLKMKEFAESKKKQELGRINQECHRLEQEIENCRGSIAQAHDEENKLLNDRFLSAEFLTFYPRYIKGQRAKIKQLEQELEEQQTLFQDKLQELVQAKGEVKVFEKMKEKAKENFKKELRRKEMLDIEEILNIKRVREKLL